MGPHSVCYEFIMATVINPVLQNVLNNTGAVIHAMPYGRQSRVWATLG